MRDAGDTEIGGFGITPADDLLFVTDIRLVKQTCTWVHVEFNDESVADYFDQQVDAGRLPAQFARIWIHTHPGNCPDPSGTDEATFARVFSGADWAVMFILARGGKSYSQLRFNIGPGGDVVIPAEVDFSCEFEGSWRDSWQDEYAGNVRTPSPEPALQPAIAAEQRLGCPGDDEFADPWWRDAWEDYTYSEHVKEEEPLGYIRDF
jgi:proteasome lid subunit RPN8/RPN11